MVQLLRTLLVFSLFLGVIGFVPAHSAPETSAYSAEQVAQLRKALVNHANANDWVEADRAYRALIDMPGVTFTARVHGMGMQAARYRGDLESAKSRAKMAQVTGGLEQADRFLADLDDFYGLVDLKGSDLSVSRSPVDATQRAAVDRAKATLQDIGKYKGYLPTGTFFIDSQRLFVSPVIPLHVLDTSVKHTCSAEYKLKELMPLIIEAEEAFVTNQTDLFWKTFHEVKARVDCLVSPISTKQATRLHRLEAMYAFSVRDEEMLRTALGTAKLLEPKHTFKSPWTEHPFHDKYIEAKVADKNAISTLLPPEDGKMQMDGKLTLRRLVRNPTVVQLFDDSGKVMVTQYTPHHKSMPPYEELPREFSPNHKYDAVKSPLGAALITSGAVVLAAGIGMMVAAGVTAGNVDNPGNTYSDATSKRNQANALWAGGLGTGAVGVGLLVTGLVIEF